VVGGTFVSTALRLSQRVFELGGLGLESSAVCSLQRLADGVAAAVLTLPPEHAAEGVHALACVLGLPTAAAGSSSDDSGGASNPNSVPSSSSSSAASSAMAPSRRLLAHAAGVLPDAVVVTARLPQLLTPTLNPSEDESASLTTLAGSLATASPLLSSLFAAHIRRRLPAVRDGVVGAACASLLLRPNRTALMAALRSWLEAEAAGGSVHYASSAAHTLAAKLRNPLLRSVCAMADDKVRVPHVCLAAPATPRDAEFSGLCFVSQCLRWRTDGHG